jgi:hypothetical protein
MREGEHDDFIWGLIGVSMMVFVAALSYVVWTW